MMEDKASGLLTALFRWAPGSRLPLHEHVEIEQTYVLEGSIEDDEGRQPARGALEERRPDPRLLPAPEPISRGPCQLKLGLVCPEAQ
jgi:anti-sigma factor ChrR (cupin superfamily)